MQCCQVAERPATRASSVFDTKSTTVCASAGADGRRAAPVRRARTPKAQRLRRARVGAGGSRPQQVRSGSSAIAEPIHLLTPGAGAVSGRTQRLKPADPGQSSRDPRPESSRGFRFCQVVTVQQTAPIQGSVRLWRTPSGWLHAESDTDTSCILRIGENMARHGKNTLKPPGRFTLWVDQLPCIAPSAMP